MATTPVRFSYTIVDELGIESAMTMHAAADDTQTLSDAVTAWATFGTLINAMISGNIVRGRVDLITEHDPAWTGKPASGSRVEQTGLFNFGVAGTPYRSALDVPSLYNAGISGGKVNNADTNVAAFINAVIAVPAVLNGQFTNLTGSDLATFVDSILSFRKRRKQLSRSSYNVTPP